MHFLFDQYNLLPNLLDFPGAILINDLNSLPSSFHRPTISLLRHTVSL